MSFRYRVVRAVAASTFVLSLGQLHAQAVAGKEQDAVLTSARAQYYNLRTAGARSFACNVDVDWPGVFTATLGKPPAADDPMAKYLSSARISIDVNLTSGAHVSWATAGTPPDSIADAATRVHNGVEQMLSGFFQSWNPFLNGTIIQANPKSLTATPTGYLIGDGGENESDQLTLDKKLVIHHLSSTSAQFSGELDTDFIASSVGLLLTKIEGDYRHPVDGPATHILMGTDYQTVQTFQIPHNLVMTVQNIATFRIALSGCTVQKSTN